MICTPDHPKDTPRPAAFPIPAIYIFAGRPEPVIVVGLGRDATLRLIGADGAFRTEPEHRVRVTA
jgi:hypothetical protein